MLITLENSEISVNLPCHATPNTSQPARQLISLGIDSVKLGLTVMDAPCAEYYLDLGRI